MHDADKPKQQAVGYGVPPVETRFKPGQSGNPLGRPRKDASHRRIVETVLAEKQRLTGRPKGSRIKFTGLELAIMILKQLATAGQQSATKLFTEVQQKSGTQEVVTRDVGYLVVPEVLTKEEWVAKYSPKEAPPPWDPETEG